MNVTQITAAERLSAPHQKTLAKSIQQKTFIEISIIASDLKKMSGASNAARERFQMAVMIDSPLTQEALLDEMVAELEKVAAALRGVRASIAGVRGVDQ